MSFQGGSSQLGSSKFDKPIAASLLNEYHLAEMRRLFLKWSEEDAAIDQGEYDGLDAPEIDLNEPLSGSGGANV